MSPTSPLSLTNSTALICLVLTTGCALSRADVKSLRDPDAARIQFTPAIETTIAALNTLRPQCGPLGNRRVRDEEIRVYQIEGAIVRLSRKRDHDIHIVLADPATPRDRIVVESDDPDFGRNVVSPSRDRLAAARQMLDALISEPPKQPPYNLLGTLVRVTGVGFFDLNHLQYGRSRSCIELHPIFTIERVKPISSQ